MTCLPLSLKRPRYIRSVRNATATCNMSSPSYQTNASSSIRPLVVGAPVHTRVGLDATTLLERGAKWWSPPTQHRDHSAGRLVGRPGSSQPSPVSLSLLSCPAVPSPQQNRAPPPSCFSHSHSHTRQTTHATRRAKSPPSSVSHVVGRWPPFSPHHTTRAQPCQAALLLPR